MKANPRPIFVVGHPRSGTTLMQCVLSSHPSIAIPPEEDFLIPLHDRFGRADDGLTMDDETVDTILAQLYEVEDSIQFWRLPREQVKVALAGLERPTLSDVIHTVYMEYVKNFPGKTRWGCKVTYFALHIHVINSLLPGAQFIHMIRDGRDVFLSLSGRKENAGMNRTLLLIRSALHWRRYVCRARKLARGLAPGIYTEMKYEDAISQPDEMCQRLCSFLAEEYCANMLNYYDETVGSRLIRTDNISQYLKKGFDPGNLQRWTRELSKSETVLYQGIAGDVLANLGYTMEKHSRMHPLYLAGKGVSLLYDLYHAVKLVFTSK